MKTKPLYYLPVLGLLLMLAGCEKPRGDNSLADLISYGYSFNASEIVINEQSFGEWSGDLQIIRVADKSVNLILSMFVDEKEYMAVEIAEPIPLDGSLESITFDSKHRGCVTFWEKPEKTDIIQTDYPNIDIAVKGWINSPDENKRNHDCDFRLKFKIDDNEHEIIVQLIERVLPE